MSALVAQFPITLDIKQNLSAIISALAGAEPDDLVILPEGALSGYSQDSAFLHDVDLTLLAESMHAIKAEVARRRVHLIFGSCVYEADKWYNAAIYYGPDEEMFVYHKVNLATSERGHFAAGSQLPTLDIVLHGRSVRVGIQLCREIRFPKQWRYLACAGAEVFVYLTNAVGHAPAAPVWRSHLVSRAAENQRFVLGTNNAHSEQNCPSMIVAPSGQVLWETLSAAPESARCELDLSQVSDWYISQMRDDVTG
ncbi:MAG: carbon-nitrogen hydrolase family protein [Chloroflexi bacterium]|nr:carbon-nitrogen hydrolase family protein [Chloroflexota bacterium]